MNSKNLPIFAAALLSLAGASFASEPERLVALSANGKAALTITQEQGECPEGLRQAELRHVDRPDSPVIGCWSLVTGYVLTIWPDCSLIILPPEAFHRTGNI